MNAQQNWKREVMASVATQWEMQDGILGPDVPLIPEPGYNNIDYESALNEPYRTLSGEHPYYVKAIRHALDKVGHIENSLVADFGCGDGRFVRMLLDSGEHRIVAMDIARDNLRRLERRLQQDPLSLDRVLLLEGDVANPPIQGRQFDLIIVVGVLLILNDGYADGVKACASRLKPGGYLLTVDPTDFGAAMYAIVRHDVKELKKVVKESTRTVNIANPDAVRYSVRSVNQMAEAHRQADQTVIDVTGIPIFPSLLFGALKQMERIAPEELSSLKELNDQLVEQYPDQWRAACVLSRCPEQYSNKQ